MVVATAALAGSMTGLRIDRGAEATRIVIETDTDSPSYSVRRLDPRTLFVDVAADAGSFAGGHDPGAEEIESLRIDPQPTDGGSPGLRIALRLAAPVSVRVEPAGGEIRLAIGRSEPSRARPLGPDSAAGLAGAPAERTLRASPAPQWRELEIPCDTVYEFAVRLGGHHAIRIEEVEGVGLYDGIPTPGDTLMVPCAAEPRQRLRYQTTGGDGLYYVLRPRQVAGDLEGLADSESSPFVGRWECREPSEPDRQPAQIVLLPGGQASGTRSLLVPTPITLKCAGTWTAAGDSARITASCKVLGRPEPPQPQEMLLRLESADRVSSDQLSCQRVR